MEPLLTCNHWIDSARERRWAVAVSGGRDSVVLLAGLLEAGVRDLLVVHVDHQLRGSESSKDAAFVAQLAAQYELPIHSVSVDVAAKMAADGQGMELAAREARWQVYAEASQHYGCSGVLLGHHADDQAETVLHNLLRGSEGLKGMHFENEIKLGEVSVRLIRPMLDLRRSAIDAYLSVKGLDFCEDRTNADPITVRNRLRHEAIPLLNDILARDVSASLTKTLESSRRCEQFIDNQWNYDGVLDPQGRLYLPKLQRWDRVLQERAMHRYLTEHRVINLSRELIERSLLLLDVSSPAKVNLPGGNWLRRKAQRLFIECAGP